jgi:hypothetical protein
LLLLGVGHSCDTFSGISKTKIYVKDIQTLKAYNFLIIGPRDFGQLAEPLGFCQLSFEVQAETVRRLPL